MGKRFLLMIFMTLMGIALILTGCSTAPIQEQIENPTIGPESSTTEVAPSSSELGEPIDTSESIIKLDFLFATDFAGSIQRNDSYAGAAAFAGFIDYYKKYNLEGTFLLDAGDALVGTPISNLQKGEPVIKIMNKMGYDAMALGNHEFDWGMDVTGQTLGQANFPILCANVYNKNGSRVDFAQPYVIIEKQGVRVGIIGLLTTETPKITRADSVEPFQFTDPVKEANVLIPQMRDEGAQVIVALTHLPAYLQVDGTYTGEVIDFANQVSGVDAIIAGHNFDPMVIDINGIPVVQTTHNGSQIGHITLYFDLNTNKVVGSSKELINVHLPINSDVAAIVEETSAELDSIFNESIGVATEDLSIDYVKEFSIGNWFADGIRKATDTQISFLNSSGIFETIKAGPITVGKVYSISPFENNLVKCEMTGQQIKDLFETTLDSTRIQQMGALQISGMRLIYDSSKPDYQKVVELTLDDGTPLNSDSKYSVSTTDFLATGGNDYGQLTMLSWEQTGILAREAVADYMKSIQEISDAVEGRITDRR